MSLKPIAVFKANVIDSPQDTQCNEFVTFVEDTTTHINHFCRSDSKGKISDNTFI